MREWMKFLTAFLRPPAKFLDSILKYVMAAFFHIPHNSLLMFIVPYDTKSVSY
jgi:hypothetical protein